MSNKSQIERKVRVITKEVKRLLPLKYVKVVIKEIEIERRGIYKDLGGIGAYCPNPHLVEIGVDLTHPRFIKSGNSLLAVSIAHELHHAARRQAGVNISRGTLLECLWSEGLADMFAYEFTGNKPLWNKSLTDRKFRALLAKAKKNFKGTFTNQMYDDWFLKGSKKKGLRRWAGYALGFEMVRRYMRRNPGKTPVSLIGAPVGKVKWEVS
jgi:hypothetical protein